LDQIGYALGGEAGARLAASLGISISADTLLRRLHGRRSRGGPTPRVLGAPTSSPEPARTTPRPADPGITSAADAEPVAANRVAQQQAQRREQKRAGYEEMLRLRAAGCTQLAIAQQVGRPLRTVHRYLSAPTFPERKPRTRPPGQLAPYRAYLEQRWRQGCHNTAQLWRELREQGFRGSYSSVPARLAEWQAQLPPEQRRWNGQRPLAHAVATVPTPGAMVWWLLGRREKLTAEQAAYLERLTTLRPQLALARELVQEFFALTRRRDAAALEPWRERVAASGLVELQRFSVGLQRDWAAVVAGLTLEWSTGPVEGQINRLKMIKRQMYGRAGVSLLRARVLPAAIAA